MSDVTALVRTDDKHVPATYGEEVDANYYCRGRNAKRRKYCRKRAGSGTTHPGVGRCSHHGGLVEGDARVRSGRYSGVKSERLAALVAQFATDPDPLNVLEDLGLARALLHDFVDRYAAYSVALIAWHDTWEGKYLPVPGAQKKALFDALAELEARLREDGELSDAQTLMLGEANAGVAFLATEQLPKPRVILDLSEAVRHVDVISKVIHRVEQARSSNAVSRPELLRIMNEMSRTVMMVLTNDLKDDAQREAIIQRITDGWQSFRL